MSAYVPTIGLEIHAELKTRTKMFCDSLNNPDETRPNVNVCPVCMAFPGTLPVANKEAILHVLRVGTALGGTLADYTEFDRKNYFYPDLPKGYQISQHEFPLVTGGTLRDVAITRIHLEEDAARSQHGDAYEEKESAYSLIDFNRAGLPLMELVTDPCIHDAQTASAFAQELQRLLRALGAGEANMEKGQMRVEANISISRDATLGTKVEVKNLNSFKSVERAIAYELARQEEALENGERIVQETRGWDESKGVTFSQRLKEESEEYRYFPDPDIPKFHLSKITECTAQYIKERLPELPWEKRDRYIEAGLKAHDAETLVDDSLYATFFDVEVLGKLSDAKAVAVGANYLLSDVRGLGAGESELKNISNGVFADVVGLVLSGDLSSRGAKDLIGILVQTGGIAKSVAEERGFLQMKDSAAISTLADEIILEHEEVVADVKAGKQAAMKFLIGIGMRKSKGSANPAELEKILKAKLLKSK